MLESCQMAASRVRDIHSEEGEEAAVDVPTSVDGSWATRGHKSRDAVVGCIAEETGQVIDAVFLCNSCPQCTNLDAQFKSGKLSHLDYYRKCRDHEEHCSRNHEGSSQVCTIV